MEAAELAKMSQYISIHAPPRGATARTSALQARNAISIHAPPRGATLDMGTFTNAVLISIHAPPRGATVNARHVADGVVISIHAPPRGATIIMSFSAQSLGFQFTPLREGRLDRLLLSARLRFISIHAPPRGATDSGAEFRSAHHISIHAPPRGATCAILVSSAGSISIHAPPRGATRACWLAADGADISIHAPPRGATEQNRRESGRRSYFNSRPSARGDRYRAASYSARKISIHAPPRGATVWLDEEPLDWPFQFTPLREGRRQPGGKRRNTHDFNSRPSARGDKSPGRTPGGSHISIHAPPRGATHPRETFPASRLFQFTPLREGRRQRNHKVSERFNFNSRPSARGDLLWLSDNVSPANFNSRPSARGDEA